MNSDKAGRKREAEQGISVSDRPGDISYFRTLAPSTGVRSISPLYPSSSLFHLSRSNERLRKQVFGNNPCGSQL